MFISIISEFLMSYNGPANDYQSADFMSGLNTVHSQRRIDQGFGKRYNLSSHDRRFVQEIPAWPVRSQRSTKMQSTLTHWQWAFVLVCLRWSTSLPLGILTSAILHNLEEMGKSVNWTYVPYVNWLTLTTYVTWTKPLSKKRRWAK